MGDHIDQRLRVVVGDDLRVDGGADLVEQLIARELSWDMCPKIVRETAFAAFFNGQPYPVCP